MTLTRKEQLLIYCLGRKTTVYDAAEAWTGEKGTKIAMGPWYNCKKELIKEGLIKEFPREGREVNITANLQNFINSTFPDDEFRKRFSHMFRINILPVFKKYIEKIIDFGLELDKKLEGSSTPIVFFDDDYTRSDILLLFGLISIWSCTEKKMDTLWSDSNIKGVYDSISWLTQGASEGKEDIIPKPTEVKGVYRWNKNFWNPKIQENFSEKERKELCFISLFSKSKKKIGRFFLLVQELMPDKQFKNFVISQTKLVLKDSIFTNDSED